MNEEGTEARRQEGTEATRGGASMPCCPVALLPSDVLMNELRRRCPTPEIAELAFFGDEELISEMRRRSNKLLVVWEKPLPFGGRTAMVPMLSWAPYTTDGLGLAVYAKDRLLQLLTGVDAATRKIIEADMPPACPDGEGR
jgi:hypothetical protein